ncbi:enoyl Coenzyme A hydratase [Heterostelium album PN500]|uniref:Enoyl Coenzyme A hydratase n=1 Tax=Heterostelium pallidum (strain ATCC 26659 / Pp 5 / PN500) TaxID=670386 RepID=D3BRK5_HETP5|nr:enoyl Coenzyme A hydratase [Heterostelium album PN500]EFA76037.1 enoyl Coenzyme A hydratase [Heterostelium album PN500]|eukprot:XP_020428171.1 enoyl Coenzyme A hydratase [Heterostelium album PN500]
MESLYFTDNSPSFISVNINDFKCVKLDVSIDGVAELVLISKNKLNMMTDQFFNDMMMHIVNKKFVAIFDKIQSDKAIKSVIIWSDGKVFTAGLDLMAASTMMTSDDSLSQADQNLALFKMIRRWQAAFDKIQKCSKPVIAAIHSHCIGGGVDMVSACDIRLCSEDATFAIKETKLAIVADLGTLQRIEKIVGPGFAREMAFTGKSINAATAEKHGLVNRVYKDKAALLSEARHLASQIAANSPLVVQSTKLILNHSQTHTVEEGLLRVALHNSSLLKSADVLEAVGAFTEKREPIFKSNL